jgi:hypothetical protein
MSVIGDALGRAERDYQAGQVRNAAKPARASKAPTADSAETAVKGIARPQQSITDGGQWFSSILMTLFIAVIGFAGYMTVYPQWVDSLWKFPAPAKREATASAVAPATPQAITNAPSIERVTSAESLAPTVPICPAIALQSPEQIFASIGVPEPLQPASPKTGPIASVEPQPSVVTTPKVEPKTKAAPEPKVKPIIEEPVKPVVTQNASPSRGRRVPRQQARQNPTRSTTKIPVRTDDFKSRFSVDGVMLGGERKMAVINGEIVGVDDEVDGAIVRAITGSGVAVEVDGRIRRVPVSTRQSSHDQSQSRDQDQQGSGFEFND